MCLFFYMLLHPFHVHIVYSHVRSCHNKLQSTAHAGSLLFFSRFFGFVSLRTENSAVNVPYHWSTENTRIRCLGRNQIIALFQAMSACNASICSIVFYTSASNRAIPDRRARSVFVIWKSAGKAFFAFFL